MYLYTISNKIRELYIGKVINVQDISKHFFKFYNVIQKINFFHVDYQILIP
jgi:hypothetical protein